VDGSSDDFLFIKNVSFLGEKSSFGRFIISFVIFYEFSKYSRTSLSAWCWDYALREVYAFREVQ